MSQAIDTKPTSVALVANQVPHNVGESKTNKYEYFCLDATKAFFAEAVSENSTYTSVLAKIALIAFPLIAALVVLEAAFNLLAAPITFIANCIAGSQNAPAKIPETDPQSDETTNTDTPVKTTDSPMIPPTVEQIPTAPNTDVSEKGDPIAATKLEAALNTPLPKDEFDETADTQTVKTLNTDAPVTPSTDEQIPLAPKTEASENVAVRVDSTVQDAVQTPDIIASSEQHTAETATSQTVNPLEVTDEALPNLSVPTLIHFFNTNKGAVRSDSGKAAALKSADQLAALDDEEEMLELAPTPTDHKVEQLKDAEDPPVIQKMPVFVSNKIGKSVDDQALLPTKKSALPRTGSFGNLSNVEVTFEVPVINEVAELPKANIKRTVVLPTVENIEALGQLQTSEDVLPAPNTQSETESTSTKSSTIEAPAEIVVKLKRRKRHRNKPEADTTETTANLQKPNYRWKKK